MAVRPKNPQKRMTYAQYSELPDDGLRYELIDGELYMSPAPNTRHQDVLGRLFLAIASRLANEGGGRVFFAPFEVHLFGKDAVQPDLIFVSDADSEVVTEAKISGVPTLVVEVLSSSSRDRRIKKDLYERYRVPEYWILDPITDQVEIYSLTVEGYGEPQILKPPELLKTPLIPGLSLNLSDIFRC